MELTEANKRGTPGSAASDTVDYEAILEKAGFGKTQFVMLLSSGLVSLSALSAQTAVGIIATTSHCEFGMDERQKGLMMSSCVTGIFLSTYLWGFACDAFGRRVVIVYTTLVACALQLIMVFVTNVWVFNTFNVLVGISFGGYTAGMYPYIGEFNISRYRPIVINWCTMYLSVALIYVPVTAWLLSSLNWSFELIPGVILRPWRLIILAYMIPGLLGALVMMILPESPKFLLSRKRDKEALDAVDWICKFNTSRSLTTLLEKSKVKLSPEVGSQDVFRKEPYGLGIIISIWKATTPLGRKPYSRNIFITAVAVFLMFFGSRGMNAWYPEIVNRISTGSLSNYTANICGSLDLSFSIQRSNMANQSENNNMTCSDVVSTKTYIDNIVLGSASLLGFAIQGLTFNRLGLKTILLSTLLISALTGLLLQFVTNSTAIMVLFCFYILMPGLAISVAICGLVNYLPTNLRGKAVSLSMSSGRLGAVFAAYFIGVTLEPLCRTTFAVFTVSTLICTYMVYLLPF